MNPSTRSTSPPRNCPSRLLEPRTNGSAPHRSSVRQRGFQCRHQRLAALRGRRIVYYGATARLRSSCRVAFVELAPRLLCEHRRTDSGGGCERSGAGSEGVWDSGVCARCTRRLHRVEPCGRARRAPSSEPRYRAPQGGSGESRHRPSESWPSWRSLCTQQPCVASSSVAGASEQHRGFSVQRQSAAATRGWRPTLRSH